MKIKRVELYLLTEPNLKYLKKKDLLDSNNIKYWDTDIPGVRYRVYFHMNTYGKSYSMEVVPIDNQGKPCQKAVPVKDIQDLIKIYIEEAPNGNTV